MNHRLKLKHDNNNDNNNIDNDNDNNICREELQWSSYLIKILEKYISNESTLAYTLALYVVIDVPSIISGYITYNLHIRSSHLPYSTGHFSHKYNYILLFSYNFHYKMFSMQSLKEKQDPVEVKPAGGNQG